MRRSSTWTTWRRLRRGNRPGRDWPALMANAIGRPRWRWTHSVGDAAAMAGFTPALRTPRTRRMAQRPRGRVLDGPASSPLPWAPRRHAGVLHPLQRRATGSRRRRAEPPVWATDTFGPHARGRARAGPGSSALALGTLRAETSWRSSQGSVIRRTATRGCRDRPLSSPHAFGCARLGSPLASSAAPRADASGRAPTVGDPAPRPGHGTPRGGRRRLRPPHPRL